MKPWTSMLVLLCLTAQGLAARTDDQSLERRYSSIGSFVLLHLSTAPFPSPSRAAGHTYGGTFFPADVHYSDSTVGVFIPSHFSPDLPFDIVVHIHGWWNNVDSVFAQFMLAEQLARSGRNAILVVPQGPKNAPDSFGGRLEEAGGFSRFIADVMSALEGSGNVRSSLMKGIVLSGHSGAYRMISFILLRGGLTDRVREVYLFDALYGQLEKYTYWLDHYDGRFIAIYTDGGGTKGTTEALMEDLTAWGIPYRAEEEVNLEESDLQDQRILFIHTELEHNDVLHLRRQFETYLRAGDTENHERK